MEKKKPTYKQALNELESIVSKIESGKPDVDELNSLVKRAAELVRYCKTKLKKTEEDLKKSLEDLE